MPAGVELPTLTGYSWPELTSCTVAGVTVSAGAGGAACPVPANATVAVGVFGSLLEIVRVPVVAPLLVGGLRNHQGIAGRAAGLSESGHRPRNSVMLPLTMRAAFSGPTASTTAASDFSE